MKWKDWIFYLGSFGLVYKGVSYTGMYLQRRTRVDEFKYGWVAVLCTKEGLGFEFAKNLASRGFKVLLISDTELQTGNIVQDLQSKYNNPNIRSLSFSFKTCAQDPEGSFSSLSLSLNSYEISGLINSAGSFAIDHLPNLTPESINEMISVNIYPMTYLTYFLLPSMIQRYATTNQRSLVVNISSDLEASAFVGSTVYGAVNRYKHFQSVACSYEYEPAVHITTFIPGMILYKNTDEHPLKPSVIGGVVPVEDYVNSALKKLYLRVGTGHWVHELHKFTHLLPDSTVYRQSYKKFASIFSYLRV
jgi:17beta-estradiol 17-dehydrogenase / very-long-chain 3-oxoacyl-CoA reductase